jgi:RHS repeat-associated protein
MGYSLTTEAETAVPAKSPASPKTHTPDSRLSNLGHRFYSAGMGRWLNRDPIEEQGGIGLYEFCANVPIRNVDPFGETIHTECSLRKWLDRYLASYTETPVGSFLYTGATKKGNDLKDLIVERMVNSKTEFRPKTKPSEESNAELHVIVRSAIVTTAIKDHFPPLGCGFVIDTYIYGGLDRATRDADPAWIPGDWGHIGNKAFKKQTWKTGLEGQHIIYLGVPDKYWGAPSESLTKDEWFDKIKGWTGSDGSTGDPELQSPWGSTLPPGVIYPTSGLQTGKK